MNDSEDNIISIEDFLRKKAEGPKYEMDYPIFEGVNVMMPGQIISGKKIVSILDYFPKRVPIPEISAAAILFPAGEERKKAEETLKMVRKRVLVPFSVHPEVVHGEEVKAYFQEIEGHRAYVLEVVKQNNFGRNLAAAFSGAEVRNYGGFRYIKML